MRCNLIYVTVKDRAEAKKIAHMLVEEKLVACANILPGMTSMYQWKNKIETAQEVVLILKTTQNMSERVTKRVLELHSYECPCVITLPIEGGNPQFLQWIEDCIS